MLLIIPVDSQMSTMGGTALQWEEISIGSNNSYLEDAFRYHINPL